MTLKLTLTDDRDGIVSEETIEIGYDVLVKQTPETFYEYLKVLEFRIKKNREEFQNFQVQLEEGKPILTRNKV